jgi:[ribosomal protein S5]-alanine N-acetyltransferase
MHEAPIITSRLELHHIPASGLIILFEEKDDRLAIAERNFTNPLQNLISSPGPLAWRVPQVKENPEVNKWFVRFIVLAATREVIGSISFHGAPDSNGMIEIGLGIEEAFQRQGYAREALTGMWLWACEFPEVKTLRYTVSPDNTASIKVIEFFGFKYLGQQMDDIDGPENIYEESVTNFSARWGNLK